MILRDWAPTPFLPVEPRERPPTPTMLKQQACAARDGGWFCHYCSVELAGFFTTEKLVRYLAPDGWQISIHPELRARWANLDHVVPRSRGGSDDLSNLVLCCPQCNSRKGTKLLSELREEWWA